MRALISSFICTGTLIFSLSVVAQQEIEQFAQQVSKKYDISSDAIIETLSNLEKNQAIIDAISSPWEAKPWHQYYPIFLTEKRLEKGLAFWQQYAHVLDRAESETGVPAEIIVAILGIESFYGTYTGKYPVLESLYTLGFHYPPRQTFFRKELGEFFALVQEENFALKEVKGSYAGAMGWGQFIPSSYRFYAVDFDNDGVRDLLANPVDAIGSVANYFKKHGWLTNQGIAFQVKMRKAPLGDILNKNRRFSHSWEELVSAGAVPVQEQNTDNLGPVKLFAFQQPDKKEYWVGQKNFYVITRYNHSPLYAMAVYQFSQQLKKARVSL